MNKQLHSLFLISVTAPLFTAPVLAQVDAIPDPHQDFYEQSRPKRASDLKKMPPTAPDYSTQRSKNQAPAAGSTNSDSAGSASTGSSSTSSALQAPGNDLDDAMSVPDSGPKPAPDRNGTEQVDAAAPSGVPAVTHPELMPRPPIPTPPAVSLLAPMNGGQLKDTLSWRTRAYKLRTESSDTKNGLVKASRLINGSFEDTVAAVAAACASKGLVIDSMYESAGQILAHPSDSTPERSRIIITVKPISKTSTLVRIGLDADNRNRQASYDDLLNRAETAINEKGLL